MRARYVILGAMRRTDYTLGHFIRGYDRVEKSIRFGDGNFKMPIHNNNTTVMIQRYMSM